MTEPLLGSTLPHIAYGGDYSPDQWPEEVWPEDVRLMREAGVNLVSLAIFSWSRLQPREDAWDFDWLDRVMNLLHEGGIRVDLATATASPPPWLSHAHPEMLPVLADGTRLWHGARQHYCPSSPVYRSASERLVEAIATRYANHPALAMWHVGNEFGCHVAACWCDVSAAAFRAWLGKRYGTIEELNHAWGTDFWSQRYSAWEEVLPPRRTPTWPNPSQQLDFMRFSSDELLECYVAERAILAKHTPGIPVTTNFMQFFKPLDYWKWAEREDIVSDDVYQDPLDPDAGMGAAMAGDLMRSLGRGRPWVLMEQTPSRVNWREINAAKAPGQMRLWSFQAVARGADGVMSFQWRQSRAGAEKHHSAMVPHGPVETSPTWHAVVQLGAELKQLDDLCGTRVPAEVAIVFDWESWWALELPSKPSSLVQALNQARAYYRHLFDANITADFAPSVRDLAKYKLVLVPNLYLVSDEAAANLNRYVSDGGALVMSCFSGIVDEREHIRLGGYPAPFAEMLGLRVEDFLPLGANEIIPVRFHDGAEAKGRIWSELIRPVSAEVIAEFDRGALKGKPAVTRHRFGKGTATYVGTILEEQAMGSLLNTAWTHAGVTQAQMPGGVEVVRRQGAGRSFLFVLNHRDAAAQVPAGPGMDLISGELVGPGGLLLPPYGVAVIAE
ncbi:MAG TPA: beta-galactosidase [Candidatus Dormibacteraeota bacterium]|nr:beta-galactosidase [Candidatus Dormibacteraeota bacterium]